MRIRRSLSAVVLTAALALAAPCVLAQGKGKPASESVITAAQAEKHRRIGEQMRKQIETAFAGEDALKTAMSADLKQIQNEKDPARRAAMIRAYQAKYRKDYLRVLAKGKVDLNLYARQLEQVYPGSRFSVIDGTHIRGLARLREVAARQTPPPPPPPPPPIPPWEPVTSPVPLQDQQGSHTLDVNLMAADKTNVNDCDANGGRNAVSGRVGVSEARSTVAGMCTFFLTRSYTFDYAPNPGARLVELAPNTEFTGRAEVFNGSAASYAQLSVLGWFSPGEQGPYIELTEALFVEAGPLWSALEERPSSDFTLPRPDIRPLIVAGAYFWTVKIQTQADCYALVGWCASDSKIKIREIEFDRY